jgi:hypothetical protein
MEQFRDILENMNKETKLRIHNITAKAAQIKFLRHLPGITKLDKEKNQSIREKLGVQNIVKEIKQYQQKMVTTHTKDGHK